ncbi:transposase [Dietzia aerolata]|uniref:Transposase n=2 Tax=Dietzia aerolata TaxID=595984 RepID=A0ABV5JNI0_9ACTN
MEPEWAGEVMDDDELLALEPDPKSRMGASRFIGYSPTAGRVLTVIAFRDDDGDLHGINAWPATGADLKLYREGD